MEELSDNLRMMNHVGEVLTRVIGGELPSLPTNAAFKNANVALKEALDTFLTIAISLPDDKRKTSNSKGQVVYREEDFRAPHGRTGKGNVIYTEVQPQWSDLKLPDDMGLVSA